MTIHEVAKVETLARDIADRAYYGHIGRNVPDMDDWTAFLRWRMRRKLLWSLLWVPPALAIWWSAFACGYSTANMRQAERNLKAASASLEAAQAEMRKVTMEHTP